MVSISQYQNIRCYAEKQICPFLAICRNILQNIQVVTDRTTLTPTGFPIALLKGFQGTCQKCRYFFLNCPIAHIWRFLNWRFTRIFITSFNTCEHHQFLPRDDRRPFTGFVFFSQSPCIFIFFVPKAFERRASLRHEMVTQSGSLCVWHISVSDSPWHSLDKIWYLSILQAHCTFAHLWRISSI